MIYVYGIWEGRNGVELGISDGYIVSGDDPFLAGVRGEVIGCYKSRSK